MTNFFKDLFPSWKKSRLHPWARVVLGQRCSASDHRYEWLLDHSLTSFLWWFIKTDHQNRGSLSIGDHPQPNNNNNNEFLYRIETHQCVTLLSLGSSCAPLCSSRFNSVYQKLRLNSMSFSQNWYVSLNCQALSLFSSRGDTLKPSKMFLYSFGFECQGCWQIKGCKIQEEWGLNPHEIQLISFLLSC